MARSAPARRDDQRGQVDVIVGGEPEGQRLDDGTHPGSGADQGRAIRALLASGRLYGFRGRVDQRIPSTA